MQNFNGSIPWYLVLRDLERRLRMVDSSLRTSTGDETLRLQGEARCIESIKNLPESLSLTVEEEKREGEKNA